MKKQHEKAASIDDLVSPRQKTTADKVKAFLATAGTGLVVCALYLGAIVLLMAPAFDVAPPA